MQLEAIIVNAISSRAANELQKYELTWTGCLWFMQSQDQGSHYANKGSEKDGEVGPSKATKLYKES